MKWIESWEKFAGWGLYFSHRQMICLRILKYKETQHFAPAHNKYLKAWIKDNDKLLMLPSLWATTTSKHYYALYFVPVAAVTWTWTHSPEFLSFLHLQIRSVHFYTMSSGRLSGMEMVKWKYIPTGWKHAHNLILPPWARVVKWSNSRYQISECRFLNLNVSYMSI